MSQRGEGEKPGGGGDRAQGGQYTQDRDDPEPDGQGSGRGRGGHRQKEQERGGGRVNRRPGMGQLPPMRIALPASYGEWGQASQPASQRPIATSSTPDTSAWDQQRARAPEQQQPCPQPPQHQPQQRAQKSVIETILDTQEIPHQEQKSPDSDEDSTSLGQVFPDRVDQDQQLLYKRRLGTSGIGGQLYEIELLMLFLLEGVTQKEDKKIDNFYLATNMEEAGDFDDVVFKYECNDNGIKKSSIVFLQAKHKETEKTAREKKITIDTLLSQSEKGDFNLRKYFSSYRKIKQLRKKEENLLFKDGVERSSFVIYTNSVFNFDKSRDCVDKAYLESGDILNLKYHSHEYYYKLNANEEVMNALRHSLDFEILVKELAQSFSSGSIDVNKTIFKDYQVPLVERVIEKKTQTEGKLREEFLNSKQESEFRNAYFQEIKKKKEFAKKSDEELKEELIKKNFQFPSNFGSAKDNLRIPLPSKLCSDKDIKEFLCELKLFVSQPNEGHLGEILKQKIQEIYKVEQNDINTVFSDVEYKVRKWWRQGNGYITDSNTFFQESARVSFWFDVQKPVDLFTGRWQELSDLHSKLQRGSEKVTVISQMTSVSGLGGIGKSELARKYAYNHANDYDGNVIWINAESYQTLTESFLRLAQDKLRINVRGIDGNQKDIKSIVENVYGFFSKRKSLFIFDNAEKRRTQDDGDKGMDTFLPSLPSQANKPYILITSRNQNWTNIDVIPLGIFTEKEATDFIREAINIKDGSQKNEIQELIEILERFPLALQQAVAYISERDKALKNVGSRFEISDYLKRYNQETIKLLDFKFPDDRSDLYTKTTFTTWKITIDRIKESNENGKRAGEILDILAYFAPDSIPVQMLLGLEVIGGDKEILGDAIELLKQYSMVNSGQGQTVLNIHRLVQQVIRIELEMQGKKERLIQEAFRLLGRRFPYGKDTSEDYSKKRELLPHLEVFLSHIDYWIAKSPEKKENLKRDYLEDLLIWMSDGYSDLGEPKKNKELLERALAIEEKHYGSDHFEVAGTLVNLGNAYGALGDPQRRKDLLERALAIKEKHYGHDHFEVAGTLVNLGNAYGALGDPQKLRDLLERALPIQEKQCGSDHFEVARTQLNLGNAYGTLGNPQEQKNLLERALPIQEKHYGSDHFEVARTLVNLGNAYGALGEPQKQKDLLERALAIKEEHYGRDHFEIARTLLNLANAYGAFGDPRNKKRLLERAVAIKEKHYGRDHFEVAIAVGNLGNAYGALGEPQKQKDLLERALAIQEKHYGRYHFEVARTLVNLGNAYGAFGNPYKRKNLLEQALAIQEKHYGRDHFEVARTLLNLGNAYGAFGDPQKQKHLLERALAIKEKHYGRDHFEVARTVVNLGNAYGALGDPRKRIDLLERALAIKEKHYGRYHFEVARTLVNLGNAHGALGDQQQLKTFLERALAIKEKHYGRDHFEVARSLVNLGNAYGALGDPQKRKDLLERALAIKEKHYGRNHFELARTLVNLGNAYGALGDPQKRKDLLERGLAIKEKHYGSDHFEVARTLVNLGNAYGALGDPQKLKDLLERALAIQEKHYGRDHFEVARTRLNLGNAYGASGDPQKQNDLLEKALPIQENPYDRDQFEVAYGAIWGFK